MNAGQTQQLAASVSGTNNTAVTWSLSPSMGSISSGGVYTAPGSVSSQQSVTVTATSQADSSKSASAKITVNPVAATAPPTTPTASAPGGMSGTWSFDAADISGSTVLDRSGNGLNGVLVNATPVAGKVNEALSFNGSNSAVAINSNSKLDLINSMTISAWIKTTNTSRTEDFLGKYDASGTEWGYILKTLPSGVIALRVGGNNTSGNRDVADTTPINDGQWHHVAVVINLGSNVQFYIDGTLRTTQGLATKASGTSAPLWIGTLPFNYFGAPFTGSLDSVRIDAQALSGSTISSIMGNAVSVVTSPSTTPPPSSAPSPSSAPAPSSGSGAAGSWSFDSGDMSGALALDRSGNGLNGNVSGATSVTGQINEGLSFNGSSSFVTVADSSTLRLTNSMTLASWVKTTNNSRTENFLGKYDASGTEWGYILKTLPSGVVGLRVGGNNVAGSRDVADTTPINDGQWHHVAVVINLGSNVQFYVDGSLRSTQGMATLASVNTAPLWIGTLPFSYFGMPFTGSLDNVKVFNQALNGSAVAALLTQ